MHLSSLGSPSTLTLLFEKLKDEEAVRKVGRTMFKREAGTAQDRIETYMDSKCDCTYSKEDMLLEKLQLFKLGDTHHKSSLKNSATQVLKQLEENMSNRSEITGRPTVMQKWLDTRYDKPPPEDYEFRCCLKSILTFDQVERAYGIEDVSSQHGDTTLETLFLDPPHVKHFRPRRNAFGAVQLCPHSLKRIMGNKEGMQPNREECVIDFLTHVASINNEKVQPRAGTRRAESLYFEHLFDNMTPEFRS